MRGVLRAPSLGDVLNLAQEGACSLCDKPFVFPDDGTPNGGTLDHVWPRSIYGGIGQVGMTLLAHRLCNGQRGNRRPTDAHIRRLVKAYRRMPRWWLRMTIADHRRELDRQSHIRFRIKLLETLIGERVR